MDLTDFGEFPAEGGQFPVLFLLDVTELAILGFEEADGLAVPALLVQFGGEEFDPVLEGPLRGTLVDGGVHGLVLLVDQGVEMVHGLHVEHLDRPLEHVPAVGDDQLGQGQVVLEGADVLVDDHPATHRVERGHNAVLGEVDG